MIEHSWTVSGKWEKQGTGLVEVMTGVTALRQPIVTDMRGARESSGTVKTVLLQKLKKKSQYNGGLSCCNMRKIMSYFTLMDD